MLFLGLVDLFRPLFPLSLVRRFFGDIGFSTRAPFPLSGNPFHPPVTKPPLEGQGNVPFLVPREEKYFFFAGHASRNCLNAFFRKEVEYKPLSFSPWKKRRVPGRRVQVHFFREGSGQSP